MLVKIDAHPDQIRWYAQSALNGFNDLDPADAVENAKADLRAILEYLDHTQKAVPVAGIVAVKALVNDKGCGCDPDVANPANLEIARLARL